MKTVLFGFCFFVISFTSAQTPEEKEKMKEIMYSCKAQTGVEMIDILKVANMQILNTRGSQCFAACVDKKQGTLGADNKINLSAALKLTENIESLADIIKQCKQQETPESDECVAAMKFHNCVAKNRNV